MNSEVKEEIEEAQEESLDTGPGQLLSNKREALGMSVQEVADKLHITMHYVRALETDAHDKLPGDVFIKGYLRAYSNLLGLEPSIVINVYNDYSNQRASAELESDTRRRRQRNKNMPWIIVSGVAFVVIALALWYFSSASDVPAQSTAPARTPAATTPTRTVTPADTSLDNVATTREVPSTPNPSVPVEETAPVEPQISETPEQSEALVTEAEADTETETEVASDEPELAAEQALVEDSEPEPAPEPLIPERLISIEGEGEDTVQIRFSGESMVQVDDANDVQLYRDVRVAGDVLRINGTAPFNILLGDASNSEMSLNGAEIDFRSSIRIDNSARLTIGL